jgi:hypothetical protein
MNKNLETKFGPKNMHNIPGSPKCPVGNYDWF